MGQAITVTERTDAAVNVRLYDADGTQTDPTSGAFTLYVKPSNADGADDDSSAIITLTTGGGGLTTATDPDVTGANVLVATFTDTDLTQTPGDYYYTVERDLSGLLTAWGPAAMLIRDR